MTKDHYCDFPFDEIRDIHGDYFHSLDDILEIGDFKDQAWSVIEAQGEDGSEWIVYGPPHHYVNRLGFVGTKEKHDGETYYHVCWRTAEEAEELALEAENEERANGS